ncbi:MAG TPA: SDR family NAD(P)-dependent oxidoreductase [Chitinophagaceae bacterium]|nr:SDR family NAD(P)-dependent oxidoreductase [Chitinophagaceae bacterium]
MKKAIVVGASSGLGRGVAEILANKDFRVCVTGRRTQLLEQLKNQYPDNVIYAGFDVTDLAALPGNLIRIVEELGGLDLFVISAGGGNLNDELDFSIEKKTIDLNISAFTATADWVYNYFRKQGHGQLAAISSIAGLRGIRHAPAYNASKAYQISYLEGLRQKTSFLKLPITITDVRPGFVDTPNAKGEGRFWQASVAKASRQITTAILKKKDVAYVTRRWWLIAMIMKTVPRWIYNKI